MALPALAATFSFHPLPHRPTRGGLPSPSRGGRLAPAAPAMAALGEQVAAERRPSGAPSALTLQKGLEEAEASYNEQWYAVGFSGDLVADVPLPMRLWGEPVVLYRDADGGAVCLKDLCPHRSAPLSMGTMEGGVLRCFYHGWAFAQGGECVDVPTFRQPQLDRAQRKQQLSSFCATAYAVVEQDGLLWVWRGNTLSADVRKLPTQPASESRTTFTCDTVLDFACDWSHLVEKNLDSPHLFWLNDGWIPPLKAFGFTQGRPSPEWRCQGTSKVIQHAVPNIVHRRGVSGFSEEIHVVPIAADRSRVLLRQRFPDIPLLQRLLQVPNSQAFLTWLVQNWNYHIALEDYPSQQDSEGELAPKCLRARTGFADELIAQFHDWRRRADEEGQPFFVRWDGQQAGATSKFGCTAQFGEQVEDGKEGTYGLKRTYRQAVPTAEFAPMNVGPYKQFLQTWQALQTNAIGGVVTVPAVFATIKTIAPAMADLGAKASGL